MLRARDPVSSISFLGRAPAKLRFVLICPMTLRRGPKPTSGGSPASRIAGWPVSQDGGWPRAQTGAGREDTRPLQRDPRQQGTTLTQPSDGARCRRCGSPSSAGRPTLAGAGSGTRCSHWTPETLTSPAPSNCSASGATHEHAQAGRDARRHGEHRGVDRGPRGRTRVPVLRPAGVGIQAAERGHARHPQAVVVVPAVRDHLGGLTLHSLQDRLRRAAPWSADPAGVRGRVPGWPLELPGHRAGSGYGSAEEPGPIRAAPTFNPSLRGQKSTRYVLALQPDFVRFMVAEWFAAGSGRRERGLEVGGATTTSATGAASHWPVVPPGR
jgi:hypothetical protein